MRRFTQLIAHTRSLSSRETVHGYVGVTLIWSAGLLMGFLELRHLQKMSSDVGIAIFALLPFVFSVVLIGLGVHLWRSRFEGTAILRVAGMVLGGIVVLGLVATWTITHQNIRGRPFAHAPFVTVNNMSIGGVIGFVIGWYQVSQRQHYRALQDEQSKLEFLNRLLRHNILNSTQIIMGNVELLYDLVSDSGQDYVETIRNRCDEINRFIDGVRLLGLSSLDEHSNNLHPVDVSEILSAEVKSARDAFPEAEFSTSIPEEIVVRADTFVPELFNNLLLNAVQHNDNATPSVTISATENHGTVVITVADDGPGIPDGRKDRVVEWNVKGVESGGTGLGLAIADTLAERYNGDLSIDDKDPRGTVITLEVPKYSPDDRR